MTLRRLSRRSALIVATAVAVIVIAEVGARGLGPYLPEALVYGDEAAQTKIAQMDARGSLCVDVAMVGDSMARDAFDPATFSAADPQHRRAYNAALDAASPGLVHRWATEEVEPRLRAPLVVIALASLDLNANATATTSARRAYENADFTRDDVEGKLQETLMQKFDLFRYRRSLRDPEILWESIRRAAKGNPTVRTRPSGIEGVIGRDGEGLSRRSLTYRGELGAKQFVRSQLLNDFVIDDEQVAIAETMIADLRASGASVVITVLPVSDDYIALHPNGRSDFDAFITAVDELARTSATPLVDLHDQEISADQFADTHHLNAAGAEWFSTELALRLEALGLNARPRCPL